MSQLAGNTNHGTSPVDNLHGGNVKTQPNTVAAGTYKRGQVLEYDSANKVFVALTDASKASVVMTVGITLEADSSMGVYVQGEDFNLNEMYFGGLDAEVVKQALRGNGILARYWQAA
ncbi:hypothetical protein SAMN04488518_11359 [Pseudovibrio ascidiaceicola]|uniref:Bacteriophage lambda head decoration protein D n=1 Tax=Pseudovibrio ascidiaceicola TaxID=285279 RepID=A0A1I4E1F7_9HYPH|nr:hypothetical protein [Pseudovibrio ascidiaceicola]SFK98377.1 hypothetical protein SAMN04488518_11359 [Pseudovibrio ascidiaceicola]